MRTHGHREGNITHRGMLGGWGPGKEEREAGVWGGITLGEMADVDDGGMERVNHRGMCVPMQ